MATTGSVDQTPVSASLAEAERFLAGLDDDWARHIAAIGPCRYQPKPTREPYEALVRAIAYQQLSVRAGDTMVARLLARWPDSAFPTPEQLLASTTEELRACGFSGSKVTAMQGIAAATLDGLVPSLVEAATLADDALIARLTTLRGVGRWTVEMFLMYSLVRMDILPVDDLGVREGYRRLKGLAQAPAPRQLRAIGEDWQPWRTVASWYLWQVPR
ncbi:UNVERIFIED_CONTAM: mag1 [Trichonephila clavipes]